MKRILSIDGGGIRGILPARFIQAIEEAASAPAASMFDMLAGTSTGGIIAIGLLAGLPAKALGDFYIQRGPEIFPTGLLRKARALDGPIYDAKPLEDALHDILGNTWLSETKGPELLVPAYCLSIPDNWFFKSWKARGTHLDPGDVQNNLDFLLKDIARATSAAPLYFEPASSWPMSHNQILKMIDGGVFANNPAGCAIASAARLWPGEKLLVVSVGTGDHSAPISLGNGGAVDVGLKIVDILMDSCASLVDYQAKERPDVDYRRFEIDVATPVGGDGQTASVAMDDASAGNLMLLELLARKLVDQLDAKEIVGALQDR